MNKRIAKTGVLVAVLIAAAGVLLLAGCQCAPPVREYVTVRTMTCNKASPTMVTVIRRTSEYYPTGCYPASCYPATTCSTLPPIGEITVVRNSCARTKMVFVSVRPVDDRCYNLQSQNFERPWPWGNYRMGDCQY
jgi:hypothetical protein